MGIIIGAILGLIILGFVLRLLKRVANGMRLVFPLILLALYVWVLFIFPAVTLTITGCLVALVLFGAAIQRHETAKIKRVILPLIDADDMALLRKCYSGYAVRERNIALDVIAESNAPNKNSIIENLFVGDLLDFYKQKSKSKGGDLLVDRTEFESYFGGVWHKRVKDGVIEFAKRKLPKKFKLTDNIQFPSRKNKNVTTRLIKIEIRRDKDPFAGAIDLD